MSAWSVTYSENRSLMGQFSDGVVTPTATPYKFSGKTELREQTGQRLRLGSGAEFRVGMSPLGLSAMTSGEVMLMGSAYPMHHKYVTSCWTCGKIANSVVDIFMRHVDEMTDEYLVTSGCLSIFEFDESNRPFVICSVSEGQKALMKHDLSKPMRQRYGAELADISDGEYDYIVSEYLDPRKWR